jgi:hypothetical protein
LENPGYYYGGRDLLLDMKNIIEGHVNELIGINQDLFNERIVICNDCEYKGKKPYGKICQLCGCRLEAKLRVDKERCPIEKW